MKLIAIHTIHRSAKVKPSIVEPGESFEPLEDEDVERLLSLGAVRLDRADEPELPLVKPDPVVAPPKRGRKAADLDGL